MTGWQSKTVAKRAQTPKVPRISRLEETLDQQLRAVLGPLNRPQREYKCVPGRRFRFDFAFPAYMLAIEVNGGIYSGGRHTRGAALEDEYEKLNLAQANGWHVLIFGPNAVQNGNAARDIEAWLKTVPLLTFHGAP